MSDKEKEFIKQLKKFLIGTILIMIPFLITGVASIIVDHNNVKTNTELIKETKTAVEAFKTTYVTRDDMMLWLDRQKDALELLRQDVKDQEVNNDAEIRAIHKEMNDMLRDLYTLKTRGVESNTPLKP